MHVVAARYGAAFTARDQGGKAIILAAVEVVGSADTHTLLHDHTSCPQCRCCRTAMSRRAQASFSNPDQRTQGSLYDGGSWCGMRCSPCTCTTLPLQGLPGKSIKWPGARERRMPTSVLTGCVGAQQQPGTKPYPAGVTAASLLTRCELGAAAVEYVRVQRGSTGLTLDRAWRGVECGGSLERAERKRVRDVREGGVRRYGPTKLALRHATLHHCERADAEAAGG